MKELSKETKIKVIKQAAIILRMHGNIAGNRVCQDWSGEAKESPEFLFSDDELDRIIYHYEMYNSGLEDYEEGYHGMHDEMVASFAMARILDLIVDDLTTKNNQQESDNMNTYNTYQEAKIANPEMRVGIVGEGAFISVIDGDVPFEICNPADYCITVEQFLKDNGELPDGALILHPDGSYNVLINDSMKGICSGHRDSFVVEVPSLEQPKQEVEWKNGDECYYTGELDDKLTFVSIHPNNDKCAIVWNGGGDCDLSCVAIDCLVKPKSERELVIEQVQDVIVGIQSKPWTDRELIGKLYDLGMLKPIKE